MDTLARIPASITIATEVKGTWGGKLLLNKGDRYVENKMKYDLIALRFCFCLKRSLSFLLPKLTSYEPDLCIIGSIVCFQYITI